jgi:Zn-dependent protease
MPIMTYAGSQGQMMLGGAKPVPVDPRNYRNVRRGDIIVSLAGIVANLLLALLFFVLLVPLGLAGRSIPALMESLALVQRVMLIGIGINLVLAFFNLLPIPPLDGSHVVKYLLPRPLALGYVRLGRYGLLILVALLWFGGRVISAWMRPATELLYAARVVMAPYLLPMPTF